MALRLSEVLGSAVLLLALTGTIALLPAGPRIGRRKELEACCRPPLPLPVASEGTMADMAAEPLQDKRQS